MSNYVSGLVWRNFPGVGSELLVMLTMADWCNDDGGNLFPSVNTVAKRIRTSVSQARRVLHRLIAEGWLDVVGNKFGGPPGSTRRYRLNVARLGEGEMARRDANPTARMDATPEKGTPSADARDGSHECEKTGSTDESQDIKKQPSITINKTRCSPSAGLDVEDLISEGVDRQHAVDWLKVRQAKRAPLTVTAWNDLKAEAMKAGILPGEAVRIAATRSWQGFMASWLESAPSKSKTTRHESSKHSGFEERAYGEGGLL